MIKTSDFILHLFTYDCTLESITREQFEMAKKGISWTESSFMTEVDRFILINMIVEDYKREAEQYKI